MDWFTEKQRAEGITNIEQGITNFEVKGMSGDRFGEME